MSSGRRLDDVLTLATLASKPDAVGAILRWLADRTGGSVALIDTEGEPVTGPPDPTRDGWPAAHRPAPAAARDAVAGMARSGTPSSVLSDADGRVTHLVALGRASSERRPGRSGHHARSPAPNDAGAIRAPYLVVVAPTRADCETLLVDAARTLGLCWRLAQAEEARRRFASAEAHTREAVLHLLMLGDVGPARRIAGALHPPLADSIRVYVVECASRSRHEIAAQVERLSLGRAWLVPCPVRPNHLIALVPPTPLDVAEDPGVPEDALVRRLTELRPACRVGMSEPVSLSDTANGYEQAFHALAVARFSPQGYAGFGRHGDLASFTGDAGLAWARGVLAGCLTYRPARRTAPGPRELLDTLTSWLTFDGAASRHLKLHRNTLAARISLLNELLGMDLHGVGDQATARLALRLHDRAQVGPAAPLRPATLDSLLATPGALAWAHAQLDPLTGAEKSPLLATVRSWLAADTRLSATAAALGISVPATRKRLIRAEALLGRSLLRSPSARHDLWLALRAVGVREADSRSAHDGPTVQG